MRTLIALTAATFMLAAVSAASAAQPYPIDFQTYDLSGGATSGLTYAKGALTLASKGLSSAPYADPFANINGDRVDGSGTYQLGTWTSSAHATSFAFNELVSSWNAITPVGTWVQSEVQPQLDDGHWGKWYVLGRWSSSDADFHRTSVGGQGDADGFVSIDTFFAKDHPAVAYRLRLTLYRRAGSSATPSVTRYSAVASNLTNEKNTFPSPTSMHGTTIDLNVPRYSQEIHHGEYPQFDGGGEAWCSPTSTAMVVAYWRRSPAGRRAAWVDPVRRPVGRLHRAQRLRLPLPGCRQLAVQHGVCRIARARRRRDAAAQPRRGGAVHQGGHPARRLDRVHSNKLTGRRHQEHERAPRRDRRLHGRRPRHRQRSRVARRRERRARLRPRAVRERMDRRVRRDRLRRPAGRLGDALADREQLVSP